MKAISLTNKPIFTEIILLLIRQSTIPYMEFCLVIDWTMDGNQVVILPPMFATRCVSFATALSTK